MKIEKFEDVMIAFDTDNEMVNATDIMKAFPGKRMNNFLRRKETIEFIDFLKTGDARISVSPLNQPVRVIKGGINQGTWMNKYLAYEFAAWLSPKFKLFIYKVFDNFLNEKFRMQQAQLDYFWDKEDVKDLYNSIK